MKKSILNISVNSENPACVHGPQIFIKTEDGEKFLCSAFRDQSECQKSSKQYKTFISRDCLRVQRQSKDKKCWIFCKNCSNLFYVMDKKSIKKNLCFKKNHDIKIDLKESDLKHPTRLMVASTDNKKNAQYLFSDSMLEYFMRTFKDLKIGAVVCLGAPRMHEMICDNTGSDTVSYLLDIDDRLLQFHDSDNYGLYNMFNDHFIRTEHEAAFNDFLTSVSGRGVLIFCDPPFGGLLQPLCSTIDRLSARVEKVSSSTPHTMLVLPYFLGKKLAEFAPKLTMLDYRVTYDNHSRMDQTGGAGTSRRRESVVRVFTDLEPVSVQPPSGRDYALCTKCKRFSHTSNSHCDRCGCCPTRHGATYHHCQLCDRCHQASKVFCARCSICKPKQHNCTVERTK